jgi:hypothetical protein
MRRRMTFEALRVIPGSLPHVDGCSTSEPVTVTTRQGCSFSVPHLTRRLAAQTMYHRTMGRLVNDGKGYGRKRPRNLPDGTRETQSVGIGVPAEI